MEALQSEKEAINNEFLKYKIKHKQKLKELRLQAETRFDDLIKENSERLRKLEQDLKE